MSDFSIRSARIDDKDSLSALSITTYSRAFGHTMSADDLRVHLEQYLSLTAWSAILARDVVLVTVVGERIVGFVQFGAAHPESAGFNSAEREIRRIYVQHEFQNRGLGAALMRRALEHPQMQNAERVLLDVWEDNHGAQRFYERHGFRTVGTRRFISASGQALGFDCIMARSKPTGGRHS